ncbi:MAG: ABC transporter permease [Proteobacteria bacterium]|nr:ABC transporter permease [Pseudomonadota bacterium]
MLRFLIKRFFSMALVLLVVSVTIFIVMHLLPGDPAAIMLGPEATNEDIAALQAEMGLDKPVWIQFADWIGRFLQGDLGKSLFFQNRSVSDVILDHLEATVLLTLLSLTMAALIGIVTGVLAAATHESIFDRGFMLFTSIAVAVPNFWLGLMLVLGFSIMVPIFPAAGYSPLSNGIWSCLSYLVLPSITLAAGAVALIARMTRACMLDVLRNEYIRTAKAKGVGPSLVIFKHALRNAIIPVVTVIGMSFANLMGGAVVTESIFNIPGVGRLLIKSVFTRDYPVIEGVVLYIAIAWTLINLLVDIIYTFIDPRLEY